MFFDWLLCLLWNLLTSLVVVLMQSGVAPQCLSTLLPYASCNDHCRSLIRYVLSQTSATSGRIISCLLIFFKTTKYTHILAMHFICKDAGCIVHVDNKPQKDQQQVTFTTSTVLTKTKKVNSKIIIHVCRSGLCDQVMLFSSENYVTIRVRGQGTVPGPVA